MAGVVIFGAGDIGKIAHYYFSHDSKHEVAGFTVDRAFRQADTFLDLPLVDFEEVTARFPPGRYKMFVAMSYAKTSKVRASKYYQAKERGHELVSYISTKCSFLTDLPIGDNCFVLEDNTVQPFVKIGSNVTLWSGNHIGHDSEWYMKEHGLFRTGSTVEPEFTDTLELDLSSVEPSLAGPKRPQDRVALASMKNAFQNALRAPKSERGFELSSDALERKALVGTNGSQAEIGHGAVAIAAITSCTNTSNPSVMIAAGLLAKKAVERGLRTKPYVKTSLAPGSRVVSEYLQSAELLAPLSELGFNIVG